MRSARKSRSNESGFALLFVFAMAAIIAITLYVALPRITFEAQRDKEALLIERGEQYKRAIQLYTRKFKRFPAKIEDLDNANGIRFLRHHYTDPMTGKDEWRVIHAGPGGVLLDSLVKPQKDKDKAAAAQSSITELLGVGGLPDADATVNPALRKRPSDQQGAPGSTTSAAAPGAPIPPDPPQGALPGTALGAAPQTPPGTLAGVQNPANPFPAVPGQSLPGQAPTAAGTTLPGRLPGNTSAAGGTSGSISAGPAMGSVVAFPQGAPVPPAVTGQINNPAAPGAAPNGTTPSAQGSAQAADLIGNLLTRPRPGGLAGLQNANSGNQTIGGGIAGVASTIKTGTGIKIYNDQDEYKKWEFVYDVAKEAQNASGIPQQGAPPGTPIGQPTGQPGASGPTGNGFGSTRAPTTPPK